MMKVLFLTAGISFLVILAVAVLINFSKRRQRKTPHGLSGMCHKTGGEVCSSCAEQVRKGDDSKHQG